MCAFHSRCKKKQKKCALNLHAYICCCRNTATCFLSCDIKGTKKTSAKALLQVVFKCIFKNWNEYGFELVTCSTEKSLTIPTFLFLPPHCYHPILKYINILFLWQDPFLEEKFFSHILIFIWYITFYITLSFFLPTHAFL